MAKRELIDRNNLESTTIVTDDFSDNEVLDVVLMEDVKETPVITEQDIVKPYLDKISAEIEEVQTYDGIYIDRAFVLEIINKYETESEG